MSSYPHLQQSAVAEVIRAKNGGRMPPPYTAAMRIPIELLELPNGNVQLRHSQSGQILGTAASRAIAEKTRAFFAS